MSAAEMPLEREPTGDAERIPSISSGFPTVSRLSPGNPQAQSRTLVWCDPPEASEPKTHRETEEAAVDLEQLRARPGEWCRLRVFAYRHDAKNMRVRLMRRAEARDFVFVTRKVSDRSHGLWACYQPPEGA